MLDCQVADAGGDAGGEKLPRRRTKFIGISKHMELERARQADKTGPDPWAVRKFAVGLVIAIFFYTYYVFVVRVAIRMVRLETDRLGNRAQGVAYLIIFHAMFIMFIWSYAKAITTPPGFARDYVQQSDPPKEEADLVDVVGYRFEDQPARRHTSTEDLRASSDAEHTFAGRDSLATRETFSAGSTLHLVEGVSAEDEIAQERPSTGAFVPPFPAIAVASQRAQSSPRNSPSCHSPTTESFTSTVPSHDPRAPSTSGTTAVSSTATFPLAFPPTVPPKVPPKAHAKDGVSPRVSSASDPRSFMNFPSPPEDCEANRPALLVERVPPQLPILSDDYRYDSREGFLRPYRSHRCKHCAQVVLKMDHHCPWVGTCVGARNYKYFYNFLQWSTAFTVFIFIALVIDNTLPLHNPSRARPSIDGQIIAIIAVSGFFSFFTGALFVAHTRLILLNMTTIEEMGMARIQARERNALARVYGFFGWRGKKETKRRWNEEWGRLGREGNLWWLGSRRANWVMVMGEDRLGWFLPIPASPVPDDGLSYMPNPRFTPDGIWRPRREWPRELR